MTRITHLVTLAILASWLAWAHPAGAVAALATLAAACAGELLPAGALRELVAPLLILVGACLGSAIGGMNVAALHAGVGTLLVALLLVPARPGGLRLVAPLCGLELVACSLPGPAPPMWLAAAMLVPVALIALALDAWNMAHHSGSPRSAWWRWALLPAAAAAVCGLAALPAAQAITTRPVRSVMQAQAQAQTPAARPPPLVFNIDHPGSIPREPTTAARLMLPQAPRGLIYLRASAAGLLTRPVGGGSFTWQPLHGDHDEPEGAPPDDGVADLVRMPGFGDAVFVPDDGDWCSLDGIVRDGDGNRWRPGLTDAVRAYRVALAGPPRRDTDSDIRDLYTALPPELAGAAWARIEDPAWRNLPALAAAERITALLRARCIYDLDRLPVSSDPLATFLFAENPDQRRGHCQFFAGACAILLRRAGHPARCVAGFASREWDGSAVVFRRLHAHAWIEVLADGIWHRVDPTPAVAHDQAERNPTSHDTQQAQPHQAVPLPPAASGRRTWWLALLLVIPALLLLWWLRRRSAAARITPAERRAHELVGLARSLGITVHPADTAAVICQRLSARTGVDLTHALAAYHAARFADGAPAPPWPEEQLRAGLSRQGARASAGPPGPT